MYTLSRLAAVSVIKKIANLANQIFDKLTSFPAKFTRREGDKEVSVTYKDYFEQRYKIVIRDLNQPLLLSVPKERDRRSGMKVIPDAPPEAVLFSTI